MPLIFQLKMSPISTWNGERSITVSQLTIFVPLVTFGAIGSIIHATALGSHVVALNKREDADELLERRAVIYSDRPAYPILKL